ncbi:hypothetical protein SAMN05421809_0399 [Natronorubrum daqingense]|uniref:Glycine-rich protein n=2 Tax=Natronorubrum daqingense TaxID=588898 RepID=A0A1N6YCV6_9EURY|nr:hypothetical protein BB347_03230 [Natronorubrum daqingense]SIR12329.1 hypothetical protein SAMN05421809_0399 [Natronorubrum daqingense]
MSDEDQPNDASDDGEEKSFRERVEEIREKRAEEGEGEGEPPESPFGGGGGGPGGMGGGGNPFAQMMGGMMGGGGGPPGMGGGPGGPGGPGGRSEEVGNEELVQEVRQLRDEMRDQTRALKRIADALEDN